MPSEIRKPIKLAGHVVDIESFLDVVDEGLSGRFQVFGGVGYQVVEVGVD